MGAASAYESSVTQEDTYRNQAELEKYNSRMAEREARYVDEQSNRQDELTRKDIDEERGAMTVYQAKSGVLTTTGSPLYMAGEFATRAELSTLEQRRQNRLQSNQQRAAAIMNRYNASIADANADAVARTRGLKVAAALFGDISAASNFAVGVTSGFASMGKSFGWWGGGK
ncbi:MAG: hypothetical protein MJ016_02130 [Victivallaceae bacterium]|nr:hypothetical protein [Victivallaceae bacterium]